MNKTFKSILALAIGAVAMTFASCSSDDEASVPSQQEIESKIVGKWKTVSMDGVAVLTNDRDIITYYSDNTATISVSAFLDGLGYYAWDNKIPYIWKAEGSTVFNKPVNTSVGLTHFQEIIEIDDNHYSYIFTKVIDPHGVEQILNWNFIEQKVTADYTKDIIGMWEGVEMTGYETYGNAEARIEYKADGTYTYYKKEGDYWVPSANVGNEYNVDGDWLANRWRPEAGADYNYEWWDIDYIKDGTMKWSALREKEDGTRFTTTFTWKKVDDSASAQNIKANIVGSWQIDHVVRYEITDGNVIHKDIIPYDFMVSTISYTSDLTFSTYDYFVNSEQPDAKIDETRAQGRYSVADRQITHTFDDEPSKMYSNMVYSIDSQTMVIINHYIEGKTEFFSLTYYRKL